MLPQIYQTIMTNFGLTKYSGDYLHEAKIIAERCGYECTILLDGALVAEYSPISGWKNYKV